MSQDVKLTRFIFYAESIVVKHWQVGRFKTHYALVKTSEFEVCPKCATKSHFVHDRRWIVFQDAPIRGASIYLHLHKRRSRCPSCKSVFTEPVQLVQKGFRTTRRYRRNLSWACNNFLDLKRVRSAFGWPNWLVYKIVYEQLEVKQ